MDAETRKFLEQYRKAMANHVPSPEERMEMENAFGKGAVVVNVLTGQRIQL